MNSQEHQEESMDFSIIDKKSEGEALCDFSAQSVLEDRPELPPPQRQSATNEFNNFAKDVVNSAAPPLLDQKNKSPRECQL